MDKPSPAARVRQAARRGEHTGGARRVATAAPARLPGAARTRRTAAAAACAGSGGGVKVPTAEEEAQYEPFRKVLSGDKLRIYNDRLKKYKLYGAGGRVLKTPEDYRDSALWCTTGVDRDGVVPVWSVDCWHFKGMAMVGTVTSKTGEGDEAPSSAFR